jgi:hypothetical protein
MRFLIGLLTVVAACHLTVAQSAQSTSKAATEPSAHLDDFQVIEFRRYIIKEGEREHFAQFFESFFPEAFQQLGAIAAGSFFERKNPSGFTWIRGFHTIEDRAIANAEFYYGSVWKEHKKTVNDRIVDSDNVLLLRPLSSDRGITILPAVDLITDADGAQGIVVAEIFAIKANSVEAFANAAEPTFAGYRAAGVREAGVLVTLDVLNNYPQLPFRTAGPYLVWLGILKDNQMLENDFNPLAERSRQSLSATGLIRATPELVVLDPTHRSRLRGDEIQVFPDFLNRLRIEFEPALPTRMDIVHKSCVLQHSKMLGDRLPGQLRTFRQLRNRVRLPAAKLRNQR